ncbi:MAG: transglycosylase SLT domain-containing protein [Thermoleophilia bacterium]|nr:transglycosylase SLT domain-containing protein [Thermoleophilia bacterium]
MGTVGAERKRQDGRRSLGDESGQALILALGGAIVVISGALALVAIAGAITGKGRAQRAADLAAISAGRSLRDDLSELLAPTTLADGRPNPDHIDKSMYLARARQAAIDAGRANGVDPTRLRVAFPDADSFAPVQVEATVLAHIDGIERGPQIEASAVAEAAAPTGAAGGMTMATGGGYSGPLVYRDGKGMRPDVAAAYDRMKADAAGDGLTLMVVSGFRSDAEQAALFAAHPDPKWVAPPGHSLHRCATELDLGPETAYAWLAANAARFGFLKRYSWEAWHFGWNQPPAPCSAAGNSAVAGGGGVANTVTTLPSFVPAQYREPLLRSSTRWNVSAALLAAQLMAESGFDPNAGSPAGAQGIAQFMPGTAASYGLTNPFDPVAAIDAQAHLMSDLLRQFGSPELALAAYNAGPGAVEPCNCIPPYPETQAYVTRILALLGGVGALLMPSFEVRLVA